MTSRRNFIKISAVGLAVAPLANLLMSSSATAKRQPGETALSDSALSVDDPQAKALHYVEDATANSPAGRQDHQFCSNCQIFTGTPGSEWGPCAIFSYRTHPKTHAPFLVSAKGWCDGWAPRASIR